LIELEDSQAAAAYGVLRSALDAELARKSRLESEAILSPKITFSKELTNRADSPVVTEMIEREQRLFQARAETLKGQIKSLEKQISQIDKEFDALSSQMNAERGSEELAREELESYRVLRDKNFISTPRLLEQKRKVLDYQSRSEERRADVARTLRLKEELNLKIISLRSDYSRGAAQELKEATNRIVELSDRLRPAEDMLKRSVIAAPVSGSVLALKTNTPGASIAPRENLLEIVPDNTTLLVEAQVGIDSIKELHLGQTADIRFSALPYRTTPLVLGNVKYIAADIQLTKEGQPYYLVQILPTPESLQASQIPQLQPGMAAEVFIQTQPRTALEYFLKPVTDTLARSFRER
jgi:HlyD family type I secretion membrane fusion protein